MTKTKYLIIAFLIAAGMAGSFVPEARARHLVGIDEALQKTYKEATDFEREEIELTAEEVRHIEEEADITFQGSHSTVVVLFTVKREDEVIGYAFEDLVLGKWGPIHYLVCLDDQGVVIETIVLDYDEIRGKPVARRRFLKQYDEKSIQDPLRLREDIDGVSGATISSRSMTDGVRKLLYVFKELKKGGDNE